jgi:hypothetical protein
MRTLLMITTVLLAAGSLPAFAQSSDKPMTMDEQLQRLRQKDPSAGVASAPAPTAQITTQSNQAQTQALSITTHVNAAPQPAGYQSMIESEGGDAIPAMPLEVINNGTVTYVTGGVSSEEADMLKVRASEFSLHVLLSGTGGEFVGDAHFRVLDSNGAEMMRISGAGPYVYVQLPAGKYTLESFLNGTEKKSTVSVTGKGATKAHIVFPSAAF